MKQWRYQSARDLESGPLERLQRIDRERGWLDTLASLLWWSFVQTYLLLYHRMRIVGRGNLPAAAPFVMVANHNSHLDAVSLVAALPWRMRHRTFPLAAADHFFERKTMAPFSGWLLNALPIRRSGGGRDDTRALRERLISQDPPILVLFPEGTRSRSGQIAPFKPGIGMLVAGTEVAVVPCYLEGTGRAFPADAKLPKPSRLRLLVGLPLHFAADPDDKAGWEAVARQVEEAVRALEPNRPG